MFWISGSDPHYKPEVVTYPYVDFGKKKKNTQLQTPYFFLSFQAKDL